MDTAAVRGLLGLFLVDGCLSCQRGPSKIYVKGTLYAGASERDFLEDKVAEIKRYINTSAGIIPYQTAERDTGRRTTVLRFRVSSTQLRPVYNLLYPAREKEITHAALELLGGRAAAWLWAEGARPAAHGVVLKRVGFLEEEARLISGWLEVLTGAASSLLLDQARPRLWFEASEASKLREALLPYAPSSRIDLFKEEP